MGLQGVRSVRVVDSNGPAVFSDAVERMTGGRQSVTERADSNGGAVSDVCGDITTGIT